MAGGEHDTLEKKPASSSVQVEEVVADEATAEFEDNREKKKVTLQIQKGIEKGRESSKASWFALREKKKSKQNKKDRPCFYTLDKKINKFTPSTEQVKEGSEIFSARKITSNLDFAQIGINITEEPESAKKEVEKPLPYKFGYVRISDFSNTNLWPWSYGETGLLKPINNQELEGAKPYHENNRDWYLNFAILYDAYKSLEKTVKGKDKEKAEKAKETRHRIALTILQNYGKTAGEGSAARSGYKQVTAYYEGSYYHRTNGFYLKDKINELLGEKRKIKNKIHVVSDPFIKEVIARNFPVLYTEESKNLKKVNTTIDSIPSFKESIENLCNNYKNKLILKGDLVFNVTEYYNNIKGENSEQEVISEIQIKIGEAIESTVESSVEYFDEGDYGEYEDYEDYEKNKESKIDLINGVIKKMKFVVVTEHNGIHYMIELNPHFEDKERYKEISPNIGKISTMLKFSGFVIDPLSAKEALLKLNPLENILHDTTEAEAEAEAKAMAKAMAKFKVEKKTKIEKLFSKRSKINLDKIKDDDISENKNKNRIPLLTLATKEYNKSHKSIIKNDNARKPEVAPFTFNDFIKHTTFKRFKALKEKENTLPRPYIQIYVPATIALLNGFKNIEVDKKFQERDVSGLLEASCHRMLIAMASAIAYSDNIIRFLNHIEIIHNQIQMILAIVNPYEQDKDFTKAIGGIGGILKEFYKPKDKEEKKVLVEKEKKIEETQPGKTQSEKKSKKKPDGSSSYLTLLWQNINFGFFNSKKQQPKNIPHEYNPKVADSLPKEKPENTLGDLLEQAEIQHKASAMHATSSALAAVEKEKGTNNLNVLVLKDNYYEAIGSDDEGLVLDAKTYKVSVLDGKELDESASLDKAIKGKVNEKFDVFLCDFHHNISTTLEEYKVENLVAHVQTLFKEGKVAPKFTVAIDSTIDFIRSNDIKEFLKAFEKEITSGKLNVVIYRSAQKFDMLGLDNYYGGYSITINDHKSYKKFNKRIADSQDNIKGLAHQGLTHLNTHAIDDLDNYRRAIIKNNKMFYDKLMEAGLGKKDEKKFYVAKSNEPNMVFIDIRGNESNNFCAGFTNFFESVTERFSFGFATTNYAPIGTKARITVGLESEETINQYVDYFKYNYEYNRKELKKVIDERKDVRAKQTSIIQIRQGIPRSMHTLSDHHFSQILMMLRGESTYKYYIKKENETKIKEALIEVGIIKGALNENQKKKKEALKEYKIERFQNIFCITNKSDKIERLQNIFCITNKSDEKDDDTSETSLKVRWGKAKQEVLNSKADSLPDETKKLKKPQKLPKIEDITQTDDSKHTTKKIGKNKNVTTKNQNNFKIAKKHVSKSLKSSRPEKNVSHGNDDYPKQIGGTSLYRHDTKGGGNCLFHALGNLLNISHEQLRADLKTYYSKNEKKYLESEVIIPDLKGKPNWNEYVEYMGTPGKWGTNLEVEAIANMFNISIAVIPEGKVGKKEIMLTVDSPIEVFQTSDKCFLSSKDVEKKLKDDKDFYVIYNIINEHWETVRLKKED